MLKGNKKRANFLHILFHYIHVWRVSTSLRPIKFVKYTIMKVENMVILIFLVPQEEHDINFTNKSVDLDTQQELS